MIKFKGSDRLAKRKSIRDLARTTRAVFGTTFVFAGLVGGLLMTGSCFSLSANSEDLDAKALQWVKMQDMRQGWIGSGIVLRGYERVLGDGPKKNLGSKEAFVYGDSVDLILYIQILEPVDPATRAVVSLPGHRTQALLGDLGGLRSMGVGAVLKWPVTILLTPVPTESQPLPFLDPETYSLRLTISRAKDGITLFHATVREFEVAPLLSDTSGNFQCLSGNEDIPIEKKKLMISEVVFPDGEPTVHPSGSGDIRSELFDGVFTHSGNPHWENVRWDVGWGESKRSIEFKMSEETIVAAVALVVPKTYNNFTVDRISVVAYDEEESGYRNIGSVVIDQDENRPALGTVWVPTKRVKTRALRIELGQDAGEFMAVSEVYVFGFSLHL